MEEFTRPKIPDRFVPGKRYSYEYVNTNFVLPTEDEGGGVSPSEIFTSRDLEQMFSVYLDRHGIFRSNLNSSFYATNIPDGVFGQFTLEHDAAWTTISWEIYQTTRLAWLLMKLNNVHDRQIFALVKAGTTIRYLDRSKYVDEILDAIGGK